MIFEDVELEFDRIKAMISEIRQDPNFRSSARDEMSLISSGYHLIDQAIAVKHSLSASPEDLCHTLQVFDGSLAWLTNQVALDIFWATMGEKLLRDVLPAVEAYAQARLPHSGHHFVTEVQELASL